jgi:hypothetical protein
VKDRYTKANTIKLVTFTLFNPTTPGRYSRNKPKLDHRFLASSQNLNQQSHILLLYILLLPFLDSLGAIAALYVRTESVYNIPMDGKPVNAS